VSTNEEMAHRFRLDPVLVAVVFAGVGLRLALALDAGRARPINDEIAYLQLAEALLRGDGYGTLFRPPLYPAFLAACGWLFESMQATRIVQAMLGGLCVPLVYGLARGVGGVSCARVAAGLFAFDPVLIGFSPFFWSETLYLAFFLGGLAVLLGAQAPLRPLRWLLAGALFGFGGLARPVLLSFLPLLLPWALYEWWIARAAGGECARPGPWALAFALLTLGSCLVVLPWTVRNYQATGALVVVDTNGPYNLFVATHTETLRVVKDDRWSQSWGVLDGQHYRDAADRDPAKAQQRALETARARIAENPSRFASKSFFEATHLFTLDNFLLRHLRNGWYGTTPGWLPAVVTLVCTLFSATLMAGGFVGWILAQPSSLRRLAVLVLLHATLVFGATYALSRYSVPLRPMLAIGLAWWMTHSGVALRRLASVPRLALAVGIVALLALSWARDLPLLYDMVATGGEHFIFVADP
jgi:4-amino-4-deoxy-L-arabinose transferase-like glycosyltransferase